MLQPPLGAAILRCWIQRTCVIQPAQRFLGTMSEEDDSEGKPNNG